MTRPGYSGRGIFTYLAEETSRLCRETGFHFVYGFPNRNSHYGFTHKLRWKSIAEMSVLQKELEAEATTSPEVGNILQIDRFQTGMTVLWDRVKQSHPNSR